MNLYIKGYCFRGGDQAYYRQCQASAADTNHVGDALERELDRAILLRALGNGM